MRVYRCKEYLNSGKWISDVIFAISVMVSGVGITKMVKRLVSGALGP